MKYTISGGCYIYEVDWNRKDRTEDGIVEEYFPEVEESIEAFLRLLENVHSREAISRCLRDGIRYSGMKEKDIRLPR